MPQHIKQIQTGTALEFTKELCLEHCEEASHLWLLRKRAVGAPHYDLADLLKLDNRLESHIDALRLCGQTGWDACKEELGHNRNGIIFSAAVLAFEGKDQTRIDVILAKATAMPELSQDIIAALGWLDFEIVQDHIDALLNNPSPDLQRIAIAACAVHHHDPGQRLRNATYSEDRTLKACTLRAIGEMGGGDSYFLPGNLQNHLDDPDAESRFYATRSVALLGDAWAANVIGAEYSHNPLNVAHAVKILKTFVEPESPFREKALNVAMRLVDRTTALAWRNELSRSHKTRRLAVIGAGIMGDTITIPTLLGQMTDPPLARVAGEAFTLITGVDIVQEGLEGKWPKGFTAGPSDDPKDNNVEPDPDEDLPWPDFVLMTAWWKKNEKRYPKETRLLMGKPITEANLLHILKTGRQRQRAAAALEMAILKPANPLFNVSAPARRQIPQGKKKAASAFIPINYGKRYLVITAVNCITPIGLDAAMTAASVRAGICRYFKYNEYLDQNDKPITVAKIKGIEDDVADTVDRLKGIVEICLQELLDDYFEKLGWYPSKAHLFLGVPCEARIGPDYGEECLRVLTRVIEKKVSNPAIEIIPRGNVSLHHAIEQAARLIEKNQDTFCIIGGIDSMLNDSTLIWFDNNGRLKSSGYGRHQGLVASEAVCFMIIEDRKKAKDTGRPILARISTLGLAEEPKPRAANEMGLSTGLSEACQTSLACVADGRIQTVFGDLNGETTRAEEWSVTELRSFEKSEDERQLWKPGMRNYGDIGAASGAVMASIVTQGFTRNWLQSPTMIFCSDDHGSCGAVILEKEIT